MTKYIKDKSGKFQGSIGEGKTSTPQSLSAPSLPPVETQISSPVSIQEQYESFQKHYFSQDGNYGDADSLTVVDTSRWTSDDWDEIDEAPDYDRPRLARLIAKKYEDDEIAEPDDIDVDDLDVDF